MESIVADISTVISQGISQGIYACGIMKDDYVIPAYYTYGVPLYETVKYEYIRPLFRVLKYKIVAPFYYTYISPMPYVLSNVLAHNDAKPLLFMLVTMMCLVYGICATIQYAFMRMMPKPPPTTHKLVSQGTQTDQAYFSRMTRSQHRAYNERVFIEL